MGEVLQYFMSRDRKFSQRPDLVIYEVDDRWTTGVKSEYSQVIAFRGMTISESLLGLNNGLNTSKIALWKAMAEYHNAHDSRIQVVRHAATGTVTPSASVLEISAMSF